MLSKEIREKLPFISIIKYGSAELIGIISNQDRNVTIMYVYTLIEGTELKQKFLQLGRIWWDESNRSIPIDMFLRGDMDDFSPYLMTLHSKDVVLLDGPCLDLESLAIKKRKKKIIRLRDTKRC